ncbi:MAG: hypothetical protein KAJ58_02900 [Candidatus Pacebacteria bacterium]|nr:hypothetical protein [Candidatus Paceibacterota bacterium]
MNKRTKIIIALVLLIGVVGLYTYSKNQTQIIDCELDTECFVENFISCTPAKIGGGAMIIKGGKPESCEIYLFNPEAKIKDQIFSEEMAMTCITNSSFPTNKFKTIDMIGFLPFELVEKANCEGKLADQYRGGLKLAESIEY